jgi:hypothetical protein
MLSGCDAQARTAAGASTGPPSSAHNTGERDTQLSGPRGEAALPLPGRGVRHRHRRRGLLADPPAHPRLVTGPGRLIRAAVSAPDASTDSDSDTATGRRVGQ